MYFRVHLAPGNTTIKTVYANARHILHTASICGQWRPGGVFTRPSEHGSPGVLAGVMFSQARAYRCVKLTVKL